MVFFPVLVIGPPTRIAALNNENKTFTIAKITIIIDSEKVAVFVKGEFLRVAQSAGKNLKATSVSLNAHDSSLAREMEALPILLSSGADTLVANGPVDTAIGTQGRSMHVMTTIADVDSEPVGYLLNLITDLIVVGVGDLIETWNAGDICGAVMP